MTVLSPEVEQLLLSCPRGILVTLRGTGLPRAVPICFAIAKGQLVTPIDEKRKRGRDVRRLGRLRDIERDPRVVILADRWNADWSTLAWVRLEGSAEILERGDVRPVALEALRSRYPPYRSMRLEDLPLIVVEPERVETWTALATRR
jgi:PPOX class probable F420-dependent enzyme